MRVPIITLALALWTPLPLASAHQQESPYTSHRVQLDNMQMPYRLLAPAALAPGRRYPLVLFLHGAGERGTDNELQLTHFPERMLAEELRSDYPCFVLAPQCPEGQRWTEVEWSAEESTPLAPEPTAPLRAAVAALHEVLRDHPVDPDRVLLTGLSMGGYGAWELATRHPDWFAAVAPICGGGDERQVARLAGLPFSVWHGAEDPIIPTRRSRVMVAALEGIGAGVSYRELEGVGHDAWEIAYGQEGCLAWLLEQKRDASRSVVAAARLLADVLADEESVAFLGDSITEAGAASGGYVALVRDVLKTRKPTARVIPAGISGHKVPDLLGRYQKDVIEAGATLVFVYIGINDVWHTQSGRGTPIDEFERGLHELVEGLKATGASLVLATPSVIGEGPPGSNELDGMLDAFAERSRSVAKAHGLELCDLRRAFQDQLAVINAEGSTEGVLTSDGVHLSPAGNRFVAIQAARALREAAVAR